MKSPFPGMDPYLEKHWRDVHQSFCVYTRDALQPQVRPALVARVDERLVIETPEQDDRSAYPDVKIIERHPARPAGGVTAVAEPITAERVTILFDERPTEGFVTIIDPAGGAVITYIEVLSPTNKKPGEDRTQYMRKMKKAARAGINVVEIDLLRGGTWTMQTPMGRVPPRLRSSYKVSIRRGWELGESEFLSLPLDRPLSAIPIPLRQGDNEAILHLQPIIDQIYANGAYDEIDYDKPPTPPFDDATAKWADELIRGARSGRA